MIGDVLHSAIEDMDDILFDPNPSYWQARDMLQGVALGNRIDITRPLGSRIAIMAMLRN
ncbi:MAG: hypothetical protein AAGC81_19590 [Pseudomonadota bacterium]